jgi:hypothetical protein
MVCRRTRSAELRQQDDLWRASRVDAMTPGGDKPGVSIWAISRLTFKEGSNSGGPRDSSDRIRRPRPKGIRLKVRTNSLLHPPNSKEKPAGSGRRA